MDYAINVLKTEQAKLLEEKKTIMNKHVSGSVVRELENNIRLHESLGLAVMVLESKLCKK